MIYMQPEWCSLNLQMLPAGKSDGALSLNEPAIQGGLAQFGVSFDVEQSVDFSLPV